MTTTFRQDPTVCISGGGMAYHLDRSCTALREGQDLVAQRGGVVGHVHRVSLSQAERAGRKPCRTCVGRSHFSQATRTASRSKSAF